MKRCISILSILVLCCVAFRLNSSVLPFTPLSPLQTSFIPEKNKKIIDYVIKNGQSISPTYEKAVCTEMVIAVLKNFVKLSKEDKKRIRIITDKNIYVLRAKKSPIPKGIYYALTKNKMGIAIDKLEDVRPGDFVQFWEFYWGHCGIVKSIDPVHKTMELYSSTPMTNGYGVLTFDIPEECYFIRLK